MSSPLPTPLLTPHPITKGKRGQGKELLACRQGGGEAAKGDDDGDGGERAAS